ncbi:helix-turn-helix domain-containing protein [Streptomyces sp. NPDC050355]|uniref:helix-turn-helix domain-containing protein n=1 Tax=Streptomyces sp. NPDC050355 TaxID=3365609 RepID=UPI00379CD020
MASPDTAHTQEEFTQALRQLVSETGKSTEEIAKQVGLSGNTVRGVTAGRNWPQQRTLKQLVRACGQDPRPWVDAWAPINDARPQPRRVDGKELQEQIDTLRAEVGRLRGQVHSLRDLLEQGEEGDRRRERRREDAYLVFLTELPIPDFRPVQLREGERGVASPVLMYAEPAYPRTEVNVLLGEVNRLTHGDSLPELARYLTTNPLPQAITTVPAYGGQDSKVPDYVKSDVDLYFARLRACLHQYLRVCRHDQPRTPSDGAGAVRP